MNMKRITASIFIVATSVLLSTPGFARTFTFHATGCQPLNPSISSLVDDEFGVHNLGTTAATIECPLSAYAVGAFQVLVMAETSVYDRSTTADVSCQLRRLDVFGGVFDSFSASSSGGGPGTQRQTLDYQIPDGPRFEGPWVLRCTLPGSQNGAFSYVTATFLQSN